MGLCTLLSRNERLIVLCVDEHAERVAQSLASMGINNLVLGIRAAKGLEFQDVVLLDFFAHIPKQDQAAWKSLFTSETSGATCDHPQVELQLKLLYTGITRSCNRLIFVETSSDTPLPSVMFRWMTGSGLAETYNTADEQAVLMTSEEWRVQGIEFALSAEGESTAMFLEKAIKCFRLARDNELQHRAQTELAINDLIATHSLPHTAQVESKLCDDEERALAGAVLDSLRCGGQRDRVRALLGLICPRVQQASWFEEKCLNVFCESIGWDI